MEVKASSIAEFHSIVEDNFYRSDTYLTRPVADEEGFELESAVAGLIPIMRFSGVDVGVRRNWAHIRAHSSELYVIWFPMRGSVSITQDANHDQVVGPDSFVITCGDRPFHAKAAASCDDDRCSQLHVLVPSHLIRTYLPNVDRICGHAFRVRGSAAIIARDIFNRLIDEAGHVSIDSAGKLSVAGLEAIADCVKAAASQDLMQVDSKQMHLERVIRYIDQHRCTQGLTADRVAAACKISRRYLHYLMSHYNTTFSQYLWESRLQQANLWLTDAEFRQFNIVDIAYMCGFRSASHFSNAYRGRFGQSPRDAREGQDGGAPLKRAFS